MTRRAKAALIVFAFVVLLLALVPVGCSVRKRMYVADNMELLNSLPAYPSAREQHTDRDSEYRNDDSELTPSEGWTSHRVYAVPRGVRMTQVLASYERELKRRGWRRRSADCGPGAFEKGEAAILVNAGSVNTRQPRSSVDVGVDALGADEC